MTGVTKSGKKYARCGHCHEFWLSVAMAKEECAACMYVAWRCRTCDGYDGTHRSVMAHAWYYLRKGELAGHTAKAIKLMLDRRAPAEGRRAA